VDLVRISKTFWDVPDPDPKTDPTKTVQYMPFSNLRKITSLVVQTILNFFLLNHVMPGQGDAEVRTGSGMIETVGSGYKIKPAVPSSFPSGCSTLLSSLAIYAPMI
jgi:hypothetical protein